DANEVWVPPWLKPMQNPTHLNGVARTRTPRFRTDTPDPVLGPRPSGPMRQQLEPADFGESCGTSARMAADPARSLTWYASTPSGNLTGSACDSSRSPPTGR